MGVATNSDACRNQKELLFTVQVPLNLRVSIRANSLNTANAAVCRVYIKIGLGFFGRGSTPLPTV